MSRELDGADALELLDMLDLIVNSVDEHVNGDDSPDIDPSCGMTTTRRLIRWLIMAGESREGSGGSRNDRGPEHGGPVGCSGFG
jgi:hypothetical protein